MDPLTQTVRLLRPQALAWKHGDRSAAWTETFPASNGAAFCLVAAGNCRFEMAGDQSRHLGEGDYLLLAAPRAWRLFNDDTPTNILTRLIGGHFHFDDANAGLLATLVPSTVHVRSTEAGAGRIHRVLGLIEEEAMSDRPGRTLVLERYLEIMLIEAIRHDGGLIDDVRHSLLAGLRDRQIGAALRALHADIRRAWTVADLAEIAGMSRSVFAERFSRIVGLPPIDYLLHWRMALAKDALRLGDSRLTDIAFACGYQSASAFSTAFSRVVGCSPARYAAQRRSRGALKKTIASGDAN
jgi:AraC-like DNA-binding protein